MGRQKALSKSQQETILIMAKSYTWAQVAFAVQSKPETVRNFYYRAKKFSSLPPKVRVCRSRITAHQSLQIFQELQKNPEVTYRELEMFIKGTYDGDGPSYSTIRRHVIQKGFITVTPTCKPLLSVANINKRLNFANKYYKQPSEFFRGIVWSDETSVQSWHRNRQIKIKVHSSLSAEARPKIWSLKSGSFSVMFWGCFTAAKKGPLVVLDGRVNSEMYSNLIEKKLVPFLDELTETYVFMQDNCRIHTSKHSMQTFQDYGIPLLEWPAQSPDLNPIENLWAIIKKRLEKFPYAPKNKKELITRVENIWEGLEISLLERLSLSVPHRLAEVRKNKGKSIKY